MCKSESLFDLFRIAAEENISISSALSDKLAIKLIYILVFRKRTMSNEVTTQISLCKIFIDGIKNFAPKKIGEKCSDIFEKNQTD